MCSQNLTPFPPELSSPPTGTGDIQYRDVLRPKSGAVLLISGFQCPNLTFPLELWHSSRDWTCRDWTGNGKWARSSPRGRWRDLGPDPGSLWPRCDSQQIRDTGFLATERHCPSWKQESQRGCFRLVCGQPREAGLRLPSFLNEWVRVRKS